MRFLEVRVQGFRNITFARLACDAPRTFLLGANGQGKSNLLEALGLVMALRSFRTQRLHALIQKGAPGFTALFVVEQEREGRTEIECGYQRGEGWVLRVDGERVERLGDFIGRFPVVPLTSLDLMLLRGSPGERRRFLDLTLSSVDPAYYGSLRDYHRALAERNRLLKHGSGAGELAAFEAQIAPRAVFLSAKRREGLEQLGRWLARAYGDLAERDEGARLEYRCNRHWQTAAEAAEALAESRERDRLLGATQAGPHRDDFHLSLHVGGAREYGSDGQQRGLCVALRIAQARMLGEALGVAPVILADDVLGELDPRRRAGFWRACPEGLQVVATGTQAPEDGPGGWRMVRVEEGAFSSEEGAGGVD